MSHHPVIEGVRGDIISEVGGGFLDPKGAVNILPHLDGCFRVLKVSFEKCYSGALWNVLGSE